MVYTFNTNQSLISPSAQRVLGMKRSHVILRSLEFLLTHASFSTQKEYSAFLATIFSTLKQQTFPRMKQAVYGEEMNQRNRPTPLIEKTPWGLVSLKKVDVAKDFIQKLLVIKQRGVLGFEYHKQKLEKLRVLEGLALLFYSNSSQAKWKKGSLTARIATVGDTFKFQPYDEHGMVALTNTVIQEISTNHLDDLYFIFDSHQTITL